MTKIVYVVGPDRCVEDMFSRHGYSVYTRWGNMENPDLICFTGGSDISPHLYGEENIASHCNEARDNFEVSVFNYFVGKVPMVGICRGGQLFNIMSGGSMIQHIDGHGWGNHPIIEHLREVQPLKPRMVNSCHHQQMVLPAEGALLVASSHDGVPEVVWFAENKLLAVQGHPEWEDFMEDYLFELIEDYMPEVLP